MRPFWRSVVAVIATMAIALCGCGPSGAAIPVDQRAAPAASSPPAIEHRRPAPAASRDPSARDLSADEALGGHTLQRHVGKSDSELIQRLEREPQISSASTFTDRATAETVVGAALRAENRAFAAWRQRSGRRPNFVLRYQADRVVGRSVRRGQSESAPCNRALVVLRWDERRRDYYVLTSYPERSR